MVSSYMQLLARRYQGKLDSDADEFIAFAVDGAKRMQQLINDLLAFSRVTTKGHDFKPVEADASLKQALANLTAAIGESQAIVTSDPLPVVSADSGQLTAIVSEPDWECHQIPGQGTAAGACVRGTAGERNGCSPSRTTASESSRATWTHLRDFPAAPLHRRRNTRARGSAWRSARRSRSVTEAGCG